MQRPCNAGGAPSPPPQPRHPLQPPASPRIGDRRAWGGMPAHAAGSACTRSTSCTCVGVGWVGAVGGRAFVVCVCITHTHHKWGVGCVCVGGGAYYAWVRWGGATPSPPPRPHPPTMPTHPPTFGSVSSASCSMCWLSLSIMLINCGGGMEGGRGGGVCGLSLSIMFINCRGGKEEWKGGGGRWGGVGWRTQGGGGGGQEVWGRRAPAGGLRARQARETHPP